MQIRLKIHSFIDIITNSSTEIFVAASDHTIENVKKLVDALLAVGGSSMRADDMFEFTLVNTSYKDRLSYWESELVWSKKCAEKNCETFDEEEWLEDNPKPDSDDEDCGDDVDLVVTLKEGIEESVHTKVATEILSRLTSLFHVGEKYN